MPVQPAVSGQTTQPAATFRHSMMEQTTAAFAAAAGVTSAFMERLTSHESVVDVVAACGPDAPPLGRRPARSRPRAPDALVLPLELGGRPCGALVALGVTPGAVDETLGGQGELLASAAALALRNDELGRQLEAAALAATERHYRLISGMAHHIKEALGAASAYTQLLDTESELTPRQQEYIQGSRRNVDRAVRLISELLDLGRADAGRMPLEWAPTDVRAVIRGMLADFQRANTVRGVAFATHLGDELPLIHSDVDMLRRVLDTLLSNALRYAPEGSTIRIDASLRSGRRADDPGGWICVSVSDNGPGVAERDEVFEEVARLETTMSPGLRLAISRRLARLLGGDLTLDTPVGPGSTFTLWLPVGNENGKGKGKGTGTGQG